MSNTKEINYDKILAYHRQQTAADEKKKGKELTKRHLIEMRLLKSLVLLRRSNIYYRNYSSVNNEVEKFSKIGKDWWDKDSSKGTGPLHSMNPTRGMISLHILITIF